MIYKTDPQEISSYLRDASNYSDGSAEKVVIPESFNELVKFLKTNIHPITIAGAGTGLTASRIPMSGVIISLEKFTEIGQIKKNFIDVGPAVSLANLNEYLDSTKYFYPPNPTEAFASIAGTVATNASGSRSYKYGVTRDYVNEIDVVLANGESVSLKRGFTIQKPLVLSDGKKIYFPDVKYTSPVFKNAAGYYIKQNMDWLDLFIGSDGSLGIFTRIQLKLLSSPVYFFSGVLFFPKEEDCWKFVDLIRKSNNRFIKPCSLEYFDERSLDRLRSKFNNIPLNGRAAIFFENDINSAEDYDTSLVEWYDYLKNTQVLLDDSWFSQSTNDLKKFQAFRHAIPVLINEENSRLGRLKIGTDMAVADEYYIDLMKFYQQELESSGIDFVVFGHLGENHLHINLLPNSNQIDMAHNLYRKLVNRVLKWNGTISAEHGVGKLKKEFFSQMVGQSSLNEMRAIKLCFDPFSLLGKGNIFD